jgi:gem associated protein 5
MLWKGLKGKITSLKWHPTQEGVLAFGTDMGSVGVFDVYNEKHKLFKSYHKGKIYAIQWVEKRWVEKENGGMRTGVEMEKEAGEMDEHEEKFNKREREERVARGSPPEMIIFSVGADGVCLMSDLKKVIKASVDVNEMIEEANAEWIENLKV